MKKITLLTAGVLFATFAFVSRTSAATGSTVSVMNSGSELVRVFYKSLQSGNVTVSIFNAKGAIVYKDKIKHSDGFMRPYNFKDLPQGEYTVQVADESGKQIEKVNYTHRTVRTITKDVLIAKIPRQEGKYVISGFISATDNVSVKIYDADGGLVFEKNYDVDGNFGEVYNLKDLKGAFSISVSDAEGSIKEFSPQSL